MIVRSRHVLAVTTVLSILVAAMPAVGALPAVTPGVSVSVSDRDGYLCASAVGCVRHAPLVASSVGAGAQVAVVPDCPYTTHCQPGPLDHRVVGQLTVGAHVSRTGFSEQVGFIVGPKPCGPRCGPYVCVESMCVVIGLP